MCFKLPPIRLNWRTLTAFSSPSIFLYLTICKDYNKKYKGKFSLSSMAIDLFEIDVAGNDALNKNFSVVVVLNQKEVYGFRVPVKILDQLTTEFNKGLLNLKNKLMFKIRLHQTILILLLQMAIKRRRKTNKCKLEICNDMDGHFHNIKYRIFEKLKGKMPTLEKDNIVMQKFLKESLVNQAAHNFYINNKKKLKEYNVCNFSIDDLRELIKKRGNQG